MSQSIGFLRFLLPFFELPLLLIFKTSKYHVLFLDPCCHMIACLVSLNGFVNTTHLYLGKRLSKDDVCLSLEVLKAVKLGYRFRDP